MSDPNAQVQPPVAPQPPTNPAQPPAPAVPPPQPVVFQLAPPVAPPPAPPPPPPVTPPATPPAPQGPDYEKLFRQYAKQTIDALPESIRGNVAAIAETHPQQALELASKLLTQPAPQVTTTPTTTPAPSAPPALPAAPPSPVDRTRAGGQDPKPPPPKTLQEAKQRMNQQAMGLQQPR